MLLSAARPSILARHAKVFPKARYNSSLSFPFPFPFQRNDESGKYGKEDDREGWPREPCTPQQSAERWMLRFTAYQRFVTPRNQSARQERPWETASERQKVMNHWVETAAGRY
jgi:hypothetical protein